MARKPEPGERRFRWRWGAPVPAEVAAAEVDRLQARSGGVTPEALVAASARQEAPLHGCFEWDDAVAGPAYRLGQARFLLRQLLVVSRPQGGGPPRPPLRYVVKVQPLAAADRAELEGDEEDALAAPEPPATAPHVYVTVSTMLDDDRLRLRYVRQAYDEARRWSERHRHIEELAAIHEAIERTPPPEELVPPTPARSRRERASAAT